MSERRRIQVMSTQLADRIAAGEVVERPASVLKELVENSLDAGASRIEVAVEGAGIELLEVSDDGAGILSEDLPLALCRHATSKLYADTDLLHLGSYGFRGEALPAIASVSRFTICSRTADASAARCLQLSGDVLAHDELAARAPGTTVRVADLFYNVPARRKFLKSPATEMGRINKLWRQLALCAFGVDLSLRQGSRVVQRYPKATSAADRDRRVASILGPDFLRNSLYFEQEQEGWRMWGWLGLPTFHRSRADEQYFFVNGRVVRDSGLQHALRFAYADVLYQDRQPVAICYLELPPDWVDVNVHPAKTEVRFQDGRRVQDFVRHNLADLIAAESRPKAPSLGSVQAFSSASREENTQELGLAFPPATVQENAGEYWQKLVAPVFAERENPAFQAKTQGLSNCMDAPLGYALGQLHGRFIVAQNQQGLVLVDQHAAHERILYERFKSQRQQGIPQQRLLLPQTVSLSPAQAELLAERGDLLQAAGLDWVRAGPNSIRIHACPQGFPSEALADLVADCLLDAPGWRPEEGDERLANIACRAAIKDGHVLSIEEMNALLRQLEASPRYAQCNHGRPTILQWTLSDLDRLFLRGR